jgi:alpha-D-ribose 1-methylphosphonate 5-triphosphate synthase subunit PhnL
MHERRVPRTQRQSGFSRVLRCIDGSAVHPAVEGLCDDFMAGVIDSRGTAKARAVELLTRVGYSADALQRRPAAFSGGQRQRSASRGRSP